MKSVFQPNTPSELSKENRDAEVGEVINDWYFYREDCHFGPVEASFVQDCLSRGLLDRNANLWKPGFKEWKKVETLKPFSAYINDDKNLDIDTDEFLKSTGLAISERVGLRDISFQEETPPSLKKNRGKGRGRHSFLKIGLVGLLCLGIIVALVTLMDSYLKEEPELFTSIRSLDTARIEMIHQNLIAKKDSLYLYSAKTKDGGYNLVMITNGLRGKHVRVSLSSEKGLIVGRSKDGVNFEQTISSEFMNLGKIFNSAGGSLSPGIYKAQVECLDCGLKAEQLYTTKLSVNVDSVSEHERSLKKFNSSL